MISVSCRDVRKLDIGVQNQKDKKLKVVCNTAVNAKMLDYLVELTVSSKHHYPLYD